MTAAALCARAALGTAPRVTARSAAEAKYVIFVIV
jgi:hypothetical protein